MDGVEPGEVEGESVGLYELIAAVVGLRVDIDAHHVEAGLLVALRGTTGLAERVEESGAGHVTGTQTMERRPVGPSRFVPESWIQLACLRSVMRRAVLPRSQGPSGSSWESWTTWWVVSPP